MKVTWTTTNFIAYQAACNNYPVDVADVRRFQREHNGEVISVYTNFWGQPCFLVRTNEGTFEKVRCTKCKILSVKYYLQQDETL